MFFEKNAQIDIHPLWPIPSGCDFCNVRCNDRCNSHNAWAEPGGGGRARYSDLSLSLLSVSQSGLGRREGLHVLARREEDRDVGPPSSALSFAPAPLGWGPS